MAAGPGRMVAEVAVPLPRAPGTDVAALRGDPGFDALRPELAAATRSPAAA
ncbi:hypothetical protein [Streptomyces sp. NPDC001744]|uniref:hypothetical protein n=1 Tax=Streptomyces sp. NPDC001744 TaxID=3364606 RepID=UPI0036B22F93